MAHNTGSGKSQSGPSQFEILPSAARTTSPSTSFFDNVGNAKGIRVYINTTAAGSSPSTTVTIQVKDFKTGEYHDLLSSAAITATGKAILEVYPGFAATANVRMSSHVGRGVRIIATHGNATTHTYSLTGEWLP